MSRFQKPLEGKTLRVKTWGSVLYEIPESVLSDAGFDVSLAREGVLTLQLMPDTLDKLLSEELVEEVIEIPLDDSLENLIKLVKTIRKTAWYKTRYSKESKVRWRYVQKLYDDIRKYHHDHRLFEYTFDFDSFFDSLLKGSVKGAEKCLRRLGEETRKHLQLFLVESMQESLEIIVSVISKGL